MTTDVLNNIQINNSSSEQKVNLMGFDRAAMEAYFLSIGEKTFRASQVMKWIHQVGASDFSEMTNLSKTLRASLSDCAEIGRLHIELFVLRNWKAGLQSRFNNSRNYRASMDC